MRCHFGHMSELCLFKPSLKAVFGGLWDSGRFAQSPSPQASMGQMSVMAEPSFFQKTQARHPLICMCCISAAQEVQDVLLIGLSDCLREVGGCPSVSYRLLCVGYQPWAVSRSTAKQSSSSLETPRHALQSALQACS